MSCHKNETWHIHTKENVFAKKKEPGKRTKIGMLLFELSQAREDFFVEVKTRPRRSTWMRENRFSLGELAIPYTVVKIAFRLV